jgi:hypothetical protein
LPYNPSDIISCAAGLAAIRPGKYLLITFCTSFERTFTLAWFGLLLDDLKGILQVLSLTVLRNYRELPGPRPQLQVACNRTTAGIFQGLNDGRQRFFLSPSAAFWYSTS